LNLHGLGQSAEVIDGPNERAQCEVLVAALELILDRLGGEAGCQPSPGRGADLPKEAADLRLAAAGEFGDPSLAESTLVAVKDHLPELGAALTDQFIRAQRPFGDLHLKSHVTDSNYYTSGQQEGAGDEVRRRILGLAFTYNREIYSSYA